MGPLKGLIQPVWRFSVINIAILDCFARDREYILDNLEYGVGISSMT